MFIPRTPIRQPDSTSKNMNLPDLLDIPANPPLQPSHSSSAARPSSGSPAIELAQRRSGDNFILTGVSRISSKIRLNYVKGGRGGRLRNCAIDSRRSMLLLWPGQRFTTAVVVVSVQEGSPVVRRPTR